MSLTHLNSTLEYVVLNTTLDSPARNSALTLRCPGEGGLARVASFHGHGVVQRQG